MTRPYLIKIVSALLNILTGVIVAFIILLKQNWFGSDDITSFIFWTLPIATGLAICGRTILNLFRRLSLVPRLLIIFVIAALISFGWLYSVYFFLGPMINAFSIPIFFLWIAGCFVQLLFLDWRLPKQVKKRSLLQVIFTLLSLPVILIASVYLLFSFSYLYEEATKPAKELYLIPSTFEGPFRVVYGEPCGVDPVIENGRRVLVIPDNGLLIIQPKFKAGIIDNEYYLIDKSGNRKKLNELYDYKDRLTRSPGVLLGGSGSFGRDMPDGSSSSESPTAVHYTDFTLFNKDTATISDRQYSLAQRKFDSLTTALVTDCRKTKAHTMH
jgi:hypothetical protein